MKNNNLLLLKGLLLSSSQWNIYRYTTDKKKKNKIIGNTIGMSVIYLLIMAYCVATCIGYGKIGIIDSAPVLAALVISLMSFIFTFLKTNGYLFGFKEYDMLMALPFEPRTVAGCKFLYMYIKSVPMYLVISVSTMIGYAIFAKPGIHIYLIWIVLSFFVPIIPMLIASFFGFIIARITAGFKKKNIAQTVLTILFALLCFASRFFIEDMFQNNKVEQTLSTISDSTQSIANIYLPARWFSEAVTGKSILGGALLFAVSVVLFIVIFLIVGASYRNINSAIKSHAAARNFKMKAQKANSVLNAIAFKEFRRIIGSTTCMVQLFMGEILAGLLGLLTLVIGFDKIVSFVTKNAPFDHMILQPAIPFIVYFFIGMIATTACTPSLEGKNYWIVQSLPITKRTLYQGKMLFNMYATVPFTLFSTLCMCISAKVPVVDTILYLLLGTALCTFSTAWGCVCGIKYMRLDWENEIEVVKQSTGVTVYVLPSMFINMALCALVVFLGIHVDNRIIAGIFTLIAAGLAAACYKRACSMADNIEKNFY